MSEKTSTDSPMGESGTPGENPDAPHLSWYTLNTRTKVNLNGVLFNHAQRQLVLYADVPRPEGNLGFEENKKESQEKISAF